MGLPLNMNNWLCLRGALKKARNAYRKADPILEAKSEPLLETHLGAVEAYPGAEKDHPGVLHAHPESIEAHPGAFDTKPLKP
jgi:hypothetical protein